MSYTAPAYDGATAAASVDSSKNVTLVIINIVIITGLVLGIIAIGLGLGLGFGLPSSAAPVTKLTAPTVTCDVATATCGCASTKPVFSSRLIDGETAVSNSWPWMVYLTMNSTKVCSGFLITQRHVLTASSCVKAYGNNITVSYGISTYQSILGATNVTNTTYVVDSYDSVAILTLGINLTYAANIRPCCLTTDLTEPFTKEHGVVTGWGETTETSNGTVAPNLQQAVVRVQDSTVCGTSFNDYQFCASFGSIKSCPIDAGAPLMTNFNNVWTCVGLITGNRVGCNTPLLFTRIGAYQSYIKNITGLIF
ncbi:hypothetical protein I4U23_025345 [Adineta vaga]|nr:hypothetical protein I4U23_025345 [Adineta vaga]